MTACLRYNRGNLISNGDGLRSDVYSVSKRKTRILNQYLFFWNFVRMTVKKSDRSKLSTKLQRRTNFSDFTVKYHAYAFANKISIALWEHFVLVSPISSGTTHCILVELQLKLAYRRYVLNGWVLNEVRWKEIKTPRRKKPTFTENYFACFFSHVVWRFSWAFSSLSSFFDWALGISSDSPVSALGLK